MATTMFGDFRNCLDSRHLSSVAGKFCIHMFNKKEIMAPQLLFIPFYKKQ